MLITVDGNTVFTVNEAHKLPVDTLKAVFAACGIVRDYCVSLLDDSNREYAAECLSSYREAFRWGDHYGNLFCIGPRGASADIVAMSVVEAINRDKTGYFASGPGVEPLKARLERYAEAYYRVDPCTRGFDGLVEAIDKTAQKVGELIADMYNDLTDYPDYDDAEAYFVDDPGRVLDLVSPEGTDYLIASPDGRMQAHVPAHIVEI